ncbi:capsid protein [Telmatospirillum sp. J64-1]|uniref:major capsid protein n=1 Tax=Telmatospirillum sp. J64-1 TaxID=2502183 RepID=UPI00115E7E6B|nr:capsid protein [Telmatospirillum sp. J64-1]
MSNTAPFQISPQLTAIAIAYRNPAYTLIADEVIPDMPAPVATKSFQYREFDMAEGYTVPDTKVGRLGAVGVVNTKSELKSETVEDYGIGEPVPLDDIEQAKTQGLDPLGQAAAYCQNIILLDKERRAAGIAFDPANYAPSNKLALSGAEKFSDPDSDPIRLLTEIMDGMIMRPNVAVMGAAVWSKFKLHPKVLKAIYPNGNGEGIATRQQVAELLEVKKLLVGESRINEARKGQAGQINRTWGNHIQLQFQDPTALGSAQGVTWSGRARFGTKVAGTQFVNLGLRGAQLVKVGESVKEFILAKDCAFLLQDVI